jgi:hypothetical protein
VRGIVKWPFSVVAVRRSPTTTAAMFPKMELAAMVATAASSFGFL